MLWSAPCVRDLKSKSRSRVKKGVDVPEGGMGVGGESWLGPARTSLSSRRQVAVSSW